jgi:ATP-dependent RNA helicase DDX6/DHH1
MCVRYLRFSFRFALHRIEQELNTEIRPIPKSIDKQLYVAEYQQDAADERAESTPEEGREK